MGCIEHLESHDSPILPKICDDAGTDLVTLTDFGIPEKNREDVCLLIVGDLHGVMRLRYLPILEVL